MNPFISERTLPFPPEAVFAAFADAQQLALWWGPAGFTNRFHTFEFSQRGRWLFDMIGPDGTVYANQSSFEAIVPHEQIVIRHDCAPLFTLTVSLQATADGTCLRWVQRFDDDAVADAVAQVVGRANEENLDRLTRVLGRLPLGG